jgi:hypothetical protein
MPAIENQVDSQFAAANLFTPTLPSHLRLLEAENIHILREVASKSGAVS